MELLNQALNQFKDLFRSMTPGARITTALLLVAVAVSIGYLFTYRGTSADLYLMNGESFTPSQLPAMEAAFAKRGLSTYQFEGTRIRIPRSQQNDYMAALAENNALPENYSSILDKVLGNVNPFADRQQRDQMLKGAKQKQLETIIRSMTGIQSAFVIYDSDTKRGFQKEAVATASVNVRPAAGSTLSDSQVLAIRTLVARSVAGLKPETVAVTDLASGQTLVGTDNAAGPLEDPYGARKKMYEQQWKQKVLEALRYVPGVAVTANVELLPELSRRKESVKHDPKTVPYQVTEKSQTTNNEGSSGAGGRPGYAAQQPNTSLSLGSQNKTTRQESEESESQTINLASGDHETVESVGLTPKRVTMSIGVPMSYFLKLWQERNPQSGGKPPDKAALEQISTEETTKIKTHVAKLLPPLEGTADAAELVQVTSFLDIPSPEPTPPSVAQNALGWLAENWTMLGMIGLAVVALSMVRSLVRNAAPVASVGTVAAAAAPAEEPAESASESSPDKASPSRLRRFTGHGPSLRDELSQLVQEDPEAAANVLRTWIGSGVPGK
jgi:flagellar M-ring protein FliF